MEFLRDKGSADSSATFGSRIDGGRRIIGGLDIGDFTGGGFGVDCLTDPCLETGGFGACSRGCCHFFSHCGSGFGFSLLCRWLPAIEFGAGDCILGDCMRGDPRGELLYECWGEFIRGARARNEGGIIPGSCGNGLSLGVGDLVA